MNNKNTQIHDNNNTKIIGKIKSHMATIYKMPQSPINENQDKLVGLNGSKTTRDNTKNNNVPSDTYSYSENLYNDYSTNSNGLIMTGSTSGYGS